MTQEVYTKLSRREREIMDIIYAAGKATAAEVIAQMQEAPSYSAVRATLRIMEEKGVLRHEQNGPSYTFFPTVSREEARRFSLRRTLETFFDGSIADAVAAFLADKEAAVDQSELDKLDRLIDEVRREGR